MVYIKQTLYLLLLPLTVCLSCFAYPSPSTENPKSKAEAYLEDDIKWLQNIALKNNQTDIRLKQASSQLIKSLSIWKQNGQLLFPESNSSVRVYDYHFLNNKERIKKLLAAASPTAWERYDIHGEALLYCNRDNISICFMLDTKELLVSLKMPREVLFSALFSSNERNLLWWLFSLGILLFLLLIIFRFRFLTQKGATLETEQSSTFKMGDMMVDPQRMRISRGHLSVNITERDLKILTCLFEHPDEVLTKDKLYNAGWGRSYIANSRSLEQHIATLRKKIDPERKLASLIETVHGQGYRYPENQS